MFRYAQPRLTVIISDGEEVGGIGIALNSIITCLSLFQKKKTFKRRTDHKYSECILTNRFVKEDTLASNQSYQCVPEIGCKNMATDILKALSIFRN